jgi:hypothetical protein
MNSDADYAHRLNDDGSFDSICLHCFHTVTTSPTEPELVFGEAQHSCPPTAVWRRKSFEKSLRQPISSMAETASGGTLGANAEER